MKELMSFVALRGMSDNFVDNANLVKIPARGVIDLGVEVALRFPKMKLAAVLLNLGDQRVQDLIGAPLPGRHWSAMFTWVF